MRWIIFIFLFVLCAPESNKRIYLPDSLPSAESIKTALGSHDILAGIRQSAQNRNLSLEEWKKAEKETVTDSDINHYWAMERKKVNFGEDTDAIDRLRESIRMRLVWSRIFHSLNIALKESSSRMVSPMFTKLKFRDSPSFGKKGAKWTVIEWSDFFCTFCKQSFSASENIRQLHNGDIHWIHKDYPLDPESKEGLRPLAISRCLWEKDRVNYFKHSKTLYQNPGRFSSGNFESYTGCGASRDMKKYEELVIADYKEALEVGIFSIPTFWVNGRVIVGSLDEESWMRLLKDAAAR